MRDDCMPTEESSGCSLSSEPCFRKDLETLINRHSMENMSDTPDFILAEFLSECLDAFDKATRARTEWFS